LISFGAAATEFDGYQPYFTDLTWPLVTECLGRELIELALKLRANPFFIFRSR
jgi:hypothetical protein